MSYETLLVESKQDLLIVTLNRVDHKNSINDQLLQELNQMLDLAEQDPQCHAIVLQGKDGFFCTGMDFEQVTQQVLAGQTASFASDTYMNVLKRFSSSAKIIIAKVDGRVLAGGMGILAACDMVIASNQSQFGLSEAMWGLLPANVMPFLIRRVGFQPAYFMTLTMQNINAQRAYEIHLVDEVSENLDDSLRRLMLSLRRINNSTVLEAKKFFRKMWLINEEMEQCAIAELKHLMAQPEVINNIKNFALHQQFPWEKNA